jgi:hypothetical protein
MKPADEVAEDVLESFPDIEAGSEPPETPLSPDDGNQSRYPMHFELLALLFVYVPTVYKSCHSHSVKGLMRAQ